MREKSGLLLSIIVAALFILIMVGINRGFASLQNVFSSDFPLGVMFGGLLTLGVVHLINWLEKSGPDDGRAATDQKRPGNRID